MVLDYLVETKTVDNMNVRKAIVFMYNLVIALRNGDHFFMFATTTPLQISKKD